ncbi:hypothetical protein LCM20_11920 [Halobacillus litoralis]|uniref:hypothetical protein n=1 Tax=Halobacillus litoralis TaxID=45668 RepID=UPI001CD1E63E|nr:hypothetical protein [Halobacillus litoralis]MCA0971304.1 hypothetical protein [Halobacillus litoralis]
MEQIKTQPRSVGENLDKTFRLTKAHFKSYFLILLLLMGPGFLINYIFLFLGGASFFQGDSSGGFMQTLNTTAESTGVQQFVLESMGSGAEFLYIALTTIAAAVLIPMAHAAILIGTTRGLKNESWSVSEVIKLAFSRFWPLFGSTLLFGLLMGIFVFIGVFAILIGGFGTVTTGSGAVSVVMIIFILIAFLILGAYFAIKLGMYFAATTFEKVAPGFSRSWKLTKGRFWATFGFFIVLGVINLLVIFLFDGVSSLLLGTSVLSTVLMNISTIITTMVLMVGYAVKYADLRTRNEASDLQDMISSYKTDEEPAASSTDQ